MAPTALTRSPSAMVRSVRSAGQATMRPLASDSRASAASSGSTPMIRAPGARAFTAVAIPAISPPPPMGTRTLVTSGRSSAISRPQVPWPATISSSSNEGTMV